VQGETPAAIDPEPAPKALLYTLTREQLLRLVSTANASIPSSTAAILVDEFLARRLTDN